MGNGQRYVEWDGRFVCENQFKEQGISAIKAVWNGRNLKANILYMQPWRWLRKLWNMQKAMQEEDDNDNDNDIIPLILASLPYAYGHLIDVIKMREKLAVKYAWKKIFEGNFWIHDSKYKSVCSVLHTPWAVNCFSYGQIGHLTRRNCPKAHSRHFRETSKYRRNVGCFK